MENNCRGGVGTRVKNNRFPPTRIVSPLNCGIAGQKENEGGEAVVFAKRFSHIREANYTGVALSHYLWPGTGRRILGTSALVQLAGVRLFERLQAIALLGIQVPQTSK